MSVDYFAVRVANEFNHWDRKHYVYIGLTQVARCETKTEALAVARILRKALREARKVK